MGTLADRYGVFWDESRHSEGRYRSIAALSLPASEVLGLQAEVASIVAAATVTEFKWSHAGRRGGVVRLGERLWISCSTGVFL